MVEVYIGYHRNKMEILPSLGGKWACIVRKGFLEVDPKLRLKDRINQRVGGGERQKYWKGISRQSKA